MGVAATHAPVAMPAIARIGPNAITRLSEALAASVGDAVRFRIFEGAGLIADLVAPPTGMVDETHVIRLHRVLRAELGHAQARAIARDAGVRTGDYLLANRIPRVMHHVLPRLPRRWAGAILLEAMRRHSWTFAGSGVFTAKTGRPMQLAIRGCPLCREASGAHEPLCDFYAGTFERLFRVLVAPDAVAREMACEANGADACRFEITW